MGTGDAKASSAPAIAGALTETSAAALLHGLPACAYVIDLRIPKLVYANKATMQLLGYTPEALANLGTGSTLDFIHPEDHPTTVQLWRDPQSWQRGDVCFTIRVLDGQREWRRVACRENILQRDAKGAPTYVLGVATEVTTASEAQERLVREREAAAQKQSEMSYLQKLVDAQQDLGTAPLDPLKLMAVTQKRILQDTPYQSTSIVSYNRTDDTMTVLSAMGANPPPTSYTFSAGRSFMGRCLHNEEATMTADVLQESGVDVALAGRLQTRSLIAAPIYISGQMWGAIGAWHVSPGIRDPVHKNTFQLLANLLGSALLRAQESKGRQDTIDALSISEERLRDAHQAAQRIAESRTAFLSNMSHEIRTPLNGVVGMIDLLNKTMLSEEQLKYTRVLRAASEGLMTVINDILDLAKIESGSLELGHGVVHLVPLLEDCIALLEPRARDKNLRLTFSVGPAAPAALRGDAARLRQVILNLLSNAIKFTDEGEVVLSVRPDQRGADTRVIFQVTDTGTGIARDKLGHLFQPFVQVHGPGSLRGGTGLGLAICKQLLELMGGAIGVESSPGVGSVFWFSVPAQEVQTITDPVATMSAPVATADPVVRHMGHVLVADDNSVNLLVATSMLTKLGCTTETVNNGREAVEAVLQRPYDLVLMDCQMPELDGFAATRAIRDSERLSKRRIPIVALTANVLQDDQDQCRMAGMDDHLAKPLRLDSLSQSIRKWLPAQTAK